MDEKHWGIWLMLPFYANKILCRHSFSEGCGASGDYLQNNNVHFRAIVLQLTPGRLSEVEDSGSVWMKHNWEELILFQFLPLF